MACSSELKLANGRRTIPCLVGGPITEHSPSFSASGSRLFVPCGSAVFCYSVRTTLPIGIIDDHRASVTAVCAGNLRPGEAEPIVTGTTAGEVKIWDAKTLTLISEVEVDGPVAALRWTQKNTIHVFVGSPGKKARVDRITIETLTQPSVVNTTVIPLSVQSLRALDANGDVLAMSDGKELVVWIERWQKSRTFSHPKRLTAISIDPQKRYISAGDEEGVVWTWWGILDDDSSQGSLVPSRWHWHARGVSALCHCGPLMLSGGAEGVLCVRRADDDVAHYVPRLGAELVHIVTSSSGKSCLSLGDNSLTFMDSLHGYSRPRWVRAVDLPQPQRQKQRMSQQVVLHSLPGSGTVATCSGKRVHLVNDKIGLLPPRSLALGSKGNTVAPRGEDGSSMRWVLRHAAFSADGEIVMTWETRVSPALGKFDTEVAESGVLKWWRRGGPTGQDEYVIDTISHTAHTEDVTMALAIPQKGGMFVSGSLDGNFKCWESLALDEAESSSCWQCVATGSWRSKPIEGGCASVDGTVLALGFTGAIALFAPDSGAELGVLPLVDQTGRGTCQASQMHCTVACDRLLLLARVTDPGSSEDVVCWDLASLTVIARVALSTALQGSGDAMLRVCEPNVASGDLRLLLVRSAAAAKEGDKKNSSKICLWNWNWHKGKNIEGFSSSVEVEATVPADIGIVDASFVGEGPTQRILCWTTKQELWDIDFAKEGKRSLLPQEDAKDADAPRGQLARLLGERSTSVSEKAQILQLPVRTTSAQQAGLTAHLLQNIIPPSAPSHLLPPPAIIWNGVLATWGKTVDDNALSPESNDASAITENAGDALQDYAGYSNSDVPLWARRGPMPAEVSKAEIVDASFMDKLVKEALA